MSERAALTAQLARSLKEGDVVEVTYQYHVIVYRVKKTTIKIGVFPV